MTQKTDILKVKPSHNGLAFESVLFLINHRFLHCGFGDWTNEIWCDVDVAFVLTETKREIQGVLQNRFDGFVIVHIVKV